MSEIMIDKKKTLNSHFAPVEITTGVDNPRRLLGTIALRFASVFASVNLATIGLGLSVASPTGAQIIPDNTLGAESSVVTPNVEINGQISDRIDGGAIRGSNIFHSFQEFNIDPNGAAYFSNPEAIARILVRVTGGNLSNISGALGVLGNAHLFLLNPNGIIFGPNARLDLNGSFLATTGDRIDFGNGNFYSATEINQPPILTIDVPIGLGFGNNPGSIINQSRAAQTSADGTESIVGLQVQPGRTLALVGGEVTLDGGTLSSAGGSIDLSQVGATLVDSDAILQNEQQTSGGRIEIGAVAANSQVGLNQSSANPQANPQILTLSYQGIENFQDIELSNLARIDATGDGGGDIQVQGRHITLKEGAQILSNTIGANPGGSLTVNASESVQLIGNTLIDGPIESRVAAAGINVPAETSISTRSFADGNAGDLIIDTKKLTVANGSTVVAQNFGLGQGGNLQIKASESVEVFGRAILLGLNPELFFPLGFDVPGFDTEFFRESAIVSIISTTSVGNGTGGNLTIETGRLIVRDGGLISSGPLFGGDGGTLNISASESVEVFGTAENGIIRSTLFANSTGTGDAKNITVNTGRLIVRDGGAVQANALASGNAGSIFITASESVEVTGRTPDGRFSSNLSAGAFAEGNAGDVVIETNQFTVKDGAEISVSGLGMESAGNLQIQANSLNLDRGILSAETSTGDRGNITLNLNNLQLRNQSAITTNASGTANGGNISLSSDTIAALENSNILANAVSGDGGNIAINTQGLFVSPNSNISASSEFGISGTITINNPTVDPSSGLIDLSENLSDPTEKIGTSCAADQGNSFIVTGRGGLPEDPTTIIRGTTVWRDLQDLSLVNNDNPKLSSDILSLPRVHPQTPTVEANRWMINDRGKIELVAEFPGSSSPNWDSPLNCQAMH